MGKGAFGGDRGGGRGGFSGGRGGSRGGGKLTLDATNCKQYDI